MKSIIEFMKKHHMMWLGLSVAFLIGLAVWAIFGFTPVSYLFAIVAFAGISTLMYFDWGYHETEPEAFKDYIGTFVTYVLLNILICAFASLKYGWLVATSCAVICIIMGVFWSVPVIGYFQKLQSK